MASASPVSRRDLRLLRISGQPSFTASKVGPPLGNWSCVIHLDHHAFHAGAGPPVELGPVHVVEPAAPLELCLELEAHVVLTRELGQRERIPKRPRSGADVDDVDEDYFRALPSTSGFTTLIALPAT